MAATTSISEELRNRIQEVLANVPDPEIPVVSVVDLGIFRGIVEDDTGNAVVQITPTYTGCPATLVIEQSIREALANAGLSGVKLDTVLSPAWTTDMISEEGRDKLRDYGIAPPPKGSAATSVRHSTAVQCPRCGSKDTQEVSRFGSTPCKALWRCCNCAEPFDRFKCH
ncbi:1,2-phenylacetyl-CoA epoxidase subunit PaaD [Aurantiacibacter sediminis]|uniref:Phenylacetate-CoA oxygenase subunit PaaJ n=1 Tax=Aurantiacibacter sediminis TaxID=2793064 RepID=A0ABS0N6Q1_9SPHN|nr:1,2-phenylacetyl-CoA epoxidase subunit PaaD [Aurantiacibacter sediminis]MBH5323447.1 phenylacetate-CoA oxygenase subunit PaaJ [Aurantiacibacter sediminis]